MAQIIEDKDSPLYQKLYKLWLQQDKPGWVVVSGGEQYRVLHPGNDEVKFIKGGSGFDDYYGSQSKGVG